MKIVLDESGNTGCVLQKNGILNFATQPIFFLGAVVVEDDEDEAKLISKYKSFKEKYNIQEEIKGSTLMTRKYNDELKYFTKNILDKEHFFIIIYDKRFYLTTLLLSGFLPRELQQKEVLEFYECATKLTAQDDDFFLKYLEYIDSPSKEKFEIYLQYLMEYDYKGFFDEESNLLLSIVEYILEHKISDSFYDKFMTFGWYENTRKTNVINCNALGEVFYYIKKEKGVANEKICYVHDHIQEFEKLMKNEFDDCKLEIKFKDSKDYELLQIVDNAVSVCAHAYNKAIIACKNDKIFESDEEWNMNLIAQIIRKISLKHINFTVPMQDWALMYSIEEMFKPGYPKRYRNYKSLCGILRKNFDIIKSNLLESVISDEAALAMIRK